MTSSQMIDKLFKLDATQHKKAQFQIQDKTRDTLRIIGAGLPRTGTTSLKAALETLGFDPCHHMRDLGHQSQKSLLFAELLKPHSHLSPEESKSRLERIRFYMSGYMATVDSPGCDIYQDLMTLYPKAKVILSVRDSDVAWWKSFSATVAVILTRRFRWLTYPIPILRAVGLLMQAITQQWIRLAGTDTLGPSIHRLHNQAVQSNVPHEKLLVFNVKMGWKPLCEFLDVPVPEEPFPNMNDTAEFSKATTGGQVIGACVWLLYLALALTLMLLSVSPDYLLRPVGRLIPLPGFKQ